MKLSELKPEENYFVCYIDLLGFSNLTKDSIKNEKRICSILNTFHSFIEHEVLNNNLAHVSLSDSIFIISTDLTKILHSLSNIFRQCILNGVLLRGGLSYGKCKVLKTKIAENIYGDAVSKSVYLEGTGKGCKIFIDESVPRQLKKKESKYSQVFKPYQSPIDYKTVDVFEWEKINETFVYVNKNIKNLLKPEKSEIKKIIRDNFKLINNLRFAPVYSWNAMSQEGRVHIYATIDFISNTTREIGKGIVNTNKLPFIQYDELANSKRAKKIVKKFNKMVEEILS